MKTLEFTLPSFWGPYLINDDPSGMEDVEIRAVDRWMKDRKSTRLNSSH